MGDLNKFDLDKPGLTHPDPVAEPPVYRPMEPYQNKVDAKVDVNQKNDKRQRIGKPLLRQVLICSGVWSSYFINGLSFGAPTVLIPHERRAENSTIIITDEMASWFSSVHGIGALPWVFILSVLTQFVGRKPPFIFVCASQLTGFIIFYCSTTAVHILTSEIIMGIGFACNMTISIIIVTEYTSPQYRGLFLTIKSASFFWEIWAANAIGTFTHWRHIGIFAFVCSVCTALSILWPESPYWLATKGRFKESADAHHWLKGSTSQSEEELEILINSQMTYLANTLQREVRLSRDRLMGLIKTITMKEFYKPLLLSTATMAAYYFSGKLVCSMYAVQLLKRITKDDYAAYMGMLILDAVTVCGMYVGCFFSKILRRRTLLFTASFTGIGFLLLISLYLYLIELQLISENTIISIILLTSFSVTISSGPMILSSSIYGELIALRFKSISMLITALISYSIMGITLKISPLIFEILNLHGTFLFYGLTAAIFTLILFKYLPETKDKTLQEIEEILKR